MKSNNGLSPIAQLDERQKCPTHPTKRKYHDGAEARQAADDRAAATGLTIEAYLCDGCGCYHLTRSAGGSSAILPDGKFTVGEFHNLAPSHPVFAPIPGDEPPLVPGDHLTRVKFARRLLETNPEPTSAELCIALGDCSGSMLRKVMGELGYRNTRGRHARWVPNEPKIDVPVIDRATGEPVPDPTEDDVSRETSSWDLPSGQPVIDMPYIQPRPRRVEGLERLRHIPLGDILDTYAAAGLRLRLTIEEDGLD